MTSIRGHRTALPRTAARVGVLSGALTSTLFLAVASAAPVAALERDDGDDPGEQLTKIEVLLLFGVVPLALMLLIWLLVWLPWLIKGNKKTGIDWDGQPEWYGGPDGEGAPAVEGGRQALSSSAAAGDSEDPGGSSARW